MTSAAFSCDMARSTRGSRTSPARTFPRPTDLARIFSTMVKPIDVPPSEDSPSPHVGDLRGCVARGAEDLFRVCREAWRRGVELRGRRRELRGQAEEGHAADP